MNSVRQLIKDFSKGIRRDELDFIMTHFSTKKIKKGEYLLVENKICKQFSIVK